MAVPLVETPFGAAHPFGLHVSPFKKVGYTKHVSLFKCAKGLEATDTQIEDVCSKCTAKVEKCLLEDEGKLESDGQPGHAKEVQFNGKLMYNVHGVEETHTCS